MPLSLGGVVMLVMYTWRRGSRILFEKTRRLETPLDDLVRILERKPPQRVPGTAVFLTSDPKSAPTALLHSLKHYKVLHEKNVILSRGDHPYAPRRGRKAGAHRAGRQHLHARAAAFRLHGNAEHPEGARRSRASSAGNSTSCRRRSSCRAGRCGRRRTPACRVGRTGCSSALARSANDATDYFQIPTDRVVEVGTQVNI